MSEFENSKPATSKASSAGAGSWSQPDASGKANSAKGNYSLRSTSSQDKNNTSNNHHQRQAGAPSTANTQTSGTHRLGSIEILNENKQRQIQLRQQESFKQHLEQRQKIIQLQQDYQQVETGAPEYARAYAAALNQTVAGGGGGGVGVGVGGTGMASSRRDNSLSTTGRLNSKTGITVNPFDAQDSAEDFASLRPQKGGSKVPPDDGDKSTTVSGKSGFLSALMDEASTTADGAQRDQSSKTIDESSEELAGNDHTDPNNADHNSSRYNKVAQTGSCSYNYDDHPSGKPFYQRDLATILTDLRGSRKLVILIVAIALLLDNMLLTSVVPIIPAYLYRLRVEREHRDLLASGGRAYENKTSQTRPGAGKMFSSLDANGDGRLDDDEIQSELERRVNQSLANVQGRFSGSFFHPQVLGANRKQAEQDDDDDDESDGRMDDSDDDQEEAQVSNLRGQRGRKPRAQPSGRPSRKEADNDDDDDDDDDEYEDVNNEDSDEKDAGQQRSAKTSQNPGRSDRKKEQQAKQRSGANKPGKSDAKAARKPGPKTANQNDELDRKDNTKAKGNGDNDRDNDDGNDDDDEELGDAQRWNKLKSSLVSMAKMSKNDTEAMGGMCLSMVMGRPNYFDSDRSSSTGRDNYDPSRPRPTVTQINRQGQTKGRRLKNQADGANLARRPDRQPPKKAPSEPSASAESQASSKSIMDKFSHLDDDVLVINHQDIVDESLEVGIMFASKPIVQALVNPLVGSITNRVGFTLPMFLGFTIMFLSTLVFAFGETYATLFLARAIQGVGSACTSVAGMSMIADRFPDDAERGNAMAIALGGLALGVVIGPPFGGFMYEFFGKPSPFIVLAVLALADGLLQLLVLQPRVSKSQEEGASLMTLIKDPYILVAAGAITFANTGIGILEPALPLWMMDTMQAKNWEQGVAFLPAALSYLFSTNLFGNLGLRIGRWRSAMLGLVIIGCSLLLIPFATRVDHLILPNGAIGFAIGMVDSTMMPMLGYLVDIRHTSVYGSVYAIGDVAFCASFVVGPALSGTLVEWIGFEGLIITTALICFGFAPLLLLLRNPPARGTSLGAGDDDAQLQEQSSLRYVNYNHLDSPDEEAQLTADMRLKSKSYVR